MKINNSFTKTVALFLFLSFMFCGCSLFCVETVAQEQTEVLYNYAESFLETIYETKNIEYNDFTQLYSMDLFDEDDNVIATISVFDRDGETDYTIHNHITYAVDEYGLDCPEILEEFPRNEKVYYGGLFNCFIISDNQIINTHSKQIVEESSFLDSLRTYKQTLINNAMVGASNKPASGFGGILTWANIVQVNAVDWENSASNYLDGIDHGTIDRDYAVPGVGLGFDCMELYESDTLTNHCGPTALLNIMIYYDWLGMDTLVNDSREDTFNRLRILSNHSNTNGVYWNDACAAVSTYMAERGYSVSTHTFQNDFSEYKSAIDNDKIVLTLITVVQSDGYYWGHFVVTLGYEEFRQEVAVQTFLGTLYGYNYLRYIRVCDGWISSNRSRFVDLNGFYNTYENMAITVN